MPLFGSSRTTAETTPAPATTTEAPNHRRSMFGRRRSSSPHSPVHSTSPKRHTGLLHKPGEDASIIAARERVMSAEAAEREADRALYQARAAVREAREHVKRLEKEAAEE